MPKLFEKGNPGKPKGAVNKVNQDIRSKFEQLLDGVGVDTMIADLQSLEPKDRLAAIMGLAEYIVPKLARSSQEITLTGYKVTFLDEPNK